MAKPTRVRYSGIAPFLDDVQVNRVQALGSSSRLTTEDIKELGQLNIVEVVDDVPQVDISIDQNENGTMDLLGLMSNKGYGCQVIVVPTGNGISGTSVQVLQGSYLINGNRVNFEGTTLNLVSGTTNYVYLNPAVSSGNVSTKVSIATSAGGAGTKPLATISVVGNTSTSQALITDTRDTTLDTIVETDYELAKADLIVPIKQMTSDTTAARTMYIERVYANNIDLSYQTSGVATASFRCESDNKRWFLNNGSQIITDEFRATSAVPSVTLTQTPSVLANGNKTLKLIYNGNVLTEGTDYSVSTNVVTFINGGAVTGGNLSIGDMVKVRYSASTGGKLFSPVPSPNQPHPQFAGGLKEGQIELYLSDNTSSRVLRVQSARISLPLPRNPIGELGSLYPYDRPLNLPVTINVTLELRDSDLEMFARLAGKTFSSATEIAITDLIKTLGLTIKIYRENDITRSKLPAGHPNKLSCKQISVPNLIPQNENWDVRTDSDANQTFEFIAHNITITDNWQ